jgi:lysozyme
LVATTMNYDRLRRQLRLHEGLRLDPYRCTAGKLSIGIGRNLDDVGISMAEAFVMLDADIARAERDLDRRLPWWRELDEVRQRVLVDMCFNLGVGGLLTFKNTLAAIHEGDFARAARGMLASRWASQVGRRADRLAEMMRSGIDFQE